MLRNVEVIDEDEVDTNVINVGCRVKVLHLDFNEEAEYSIVGSAEADPAEQKISNESPLGKALLGHKIEETVEFEAPNGILQVKILDITKL